MPRCEHAPNRLQSYKFLYPHPLLDPHLLVFHLSSRTFFPLLFLTLQFTKQNPIPLNSECRLKRSWYVQFPRIRARVSCSPCLFSFSLVLVFNSLVILSPSTMACTAVRRVSSSALASTTLCVPSHLLLTHFPNLIWISQGRQVVEVQFEPGEVYKTWYPNVRRIRRTVSYTPAKHRTIERTVYW